MTMLAKAQALFGRPEFLQAFHGWATVVWFVASTPLAVSPLATQVQFVTWLSLYAVVTGHWSSWQAARVEKKQDEELEQMIESALAPIKEELANLRITLLAREAAVMPNDAQDAPTERRGQSLARNHPLNNLPGDILPGLGDCISDVPSEILDAVAEFHDNEEPPDTPLPKGMKVA
jgi:hypothetical protein